MSCSSSRVAVCLPCLRLQSACFLIGYHSVQHDSFADGMLSFTWCPSHPLPTRTAGFLDIKYFRISNFPDRLPGRTGRLKSLLTHNPENHQMIWPQEGGRGGLSCSVRPPPFTCIHTLQSVFCFNQHDLSRSKQADESPAADSVCSPVSHLRHAVHNLLHTQSLSLRDADLQRPQE